MTELIEFLVKALVEDPEAVVVEELEEDGDLVYEVTVADGDLGRVIGKGGRAANAIRTIAKAAAGRIDRRVIGDMLDCADEARHIHAVPRGVRVVPHAALGHQRRRRRQRTAADRLPGDDAAESGTGRRFALRGWGGDGAEGRRRRCGADGGVRGGGEAADGAALAD